jgi:hypothetical protein
MAIINNNLIGIDRPIWEQLTASPVNNNAEGSWLASDGSRYLYQLSGTALARYDTWTDSWMPLTGAGLTAVAGSVLIYTPAVGTQLDGQVFGSLYLFVAGNPTSVMRRYDIATDTWSGNLAVPSGAFGTDADMVYPSAGKDRYAGGAFHAAAITTVTVTVSAVVGATTLTANVTGGGLAAGAVLNFGTLEAPLWAVLTAGVGQGSGVALSVSPLLAGINSAAVAYWNDHMYFIGNNSTVLRRYTASSNVWSTASANSGLPGLPAVPSTPTQGCSIHWLPGAVDGTDAPASMRDALVIVRGAATNTIHIYDLQTNAFRTWNASTTYPCNPRGGISFTTGSTAIPVAGKNAAGQPSALVIQQSNTGRWYLLDFAKRRLEGFGTNNIQLNSTAYTGNKGGAAISPDGMEFIYAAQSNTSTLTRCPVWLP